MTLLDYFLLLLNQILKETVQSTTSTQSKLTDHWLGVNLLPPRENRGLPSISLTQELIQLQPHENYEHVEYTYGILYKVVPPSYKLVYNPHELVQL